MKLRLVFVSICLTGLAVAQVQPGPRPRPRDFGPGPGLGAGLGPGMNEQRLTRALGLSAEQQNRIHTAFQEAQVITKGAPEKTAELQKQLSAAIKAGNEGEIDRISQDLARLHQEQLATQAKTMAKVYAALTPEQKAKFDQVVDGPPGGRGPGFPGRPGRGGPPNGPQQ